MKLKLVLVGIEGSINLGFILRLADNFGVKEIVLVKPRISDYDEAKRFAAKAGKLLENVKIVDVLSSAFDENEVKVCTTAKPGQESDVLRHTITSRELPGAISGREKIALIFGRESTGLTRNELSVCDLLVNIPSSEKYPALNLSHAVSIILYELFTSLTSNNLVKPRPADKKQLDFLVESFNEIVNNVVEDENKRKRAIIAFRRLVFKASPTSGEVKIISYVLRKALRRLSK